MRQALKKLTALLLSIAMVLSLFTDILPAAYAAGERASVPIDKDYDDIAVTRQPGLYIDFLGDNRKYLPDGSTAVTSGPAAPGSEDQSAVTNPGAPRTWAGYQFQETDGGGNSLYGDLYAGKDTVFWVGVGIDKMNELDLFTQGSDGIYSLELGFYYDNRFIEPYTGLTGTHTDGDIRQAYRKVIEDANLTNYAQYRWKDFRVVSAETGLRPQTDRVTQEIIAGPDMDTIMDPRTANPWRMTYVAIERDPEKAGAANRSFLSPDTDGNKDKTKYLLIIPFRLKAYDSNFRNSLSLRLVRNAGMFSIGGGEDGASPYAAWERVTTRNPGRELKLMANFRGDLNIFSGDRDRDRLYDAKLVLNNGGGTDNTAVLSVDGDPSPNKVSVNEDGQSILKLPGGTGLRLDVTKQTGYQVKVRVYPEMDLDKPEDQKTYFPYTEVWDDKKGTYGIIMPNENVIVEVIFGVVDNTEFNLYLDENRAGETPAVSGGTVKGNDTVLTARYPGYPTPPAPRDPTEARTVTVDKNSPRDNSLNLPGELVTVEAKASGIKTTLTVDVALHADYYAEVELYDVASRQAILPTTRTGTDISVDADSKIIMPYGGRLEIEEMHQSDMIVRVRYLPAGRFTAALEVWHRDTPPRDTNVAQLRTLGYNDDNEGMYAYSGVVYDDDSVTPEDHSAVKAPFRVLPAVETRAASLSGSLGGDGSTPKPWLESSPDGIAPTRPDPNSILALLYSAGSETSYTNKLQAYDLRKLTGLSRGEGLRKNARGEYYADSEMTEAYRRLLEIRTLAEAEIQAAAAAAASTPSGVEEVKVPDSANPAKTLFTYYKLTPDQVQVYLLDYEKYQADLIKYQAERVKYQADLEKYQTEVLTDPAAVPPVEPVAPAAPTLCTDADARVKLAGYTWYDPTGTHNTRPPTTPTTGTPGYILETRGGRRMAVVLEPSSAYTVGTVEILDAGDRTLLDTAVRDPDYQNVYQFNMPQKNCIVKVTYVERNVHGLSLSIKVVNGREEPGNVTTVTALGPDTAAPAAKRLTLREYRAGVGSTYQVLEDSVVTVLVNRIPGYRASASVHITSNNGTVSTTPSAAILADMADGTVFTFRMPAQDARVDVIYTREVRTNNANLELAGDYSGGKGYWDGTVNSLVKTDVPTGDKLKAYIDIQPGYYIVSAEAYTGLGAYPFTLSGNGWNNGRGGRVELDTRMPNEEYFVRVTIARATPPEEGTATLTLQVIDPDNAGTGDPPVYDDNNATARATGLTLGPVGLARTGLFLVPEGSNTVAGSAGPASGTVKPGDTVEVEYTLQDGYILGGIRVEPSGLGVAPVFLRGQDGKVRARFTMPAASATVVVTFRKSENSSQLFLNLNKTEDGVPATKNAPGEPGNTVTWVKSATFDRNPNLLVAGTSEHRYGLSGHNLPTTVPRPDSGVTTGVALPGEWVSLNVRTAVGWYVHSITVTDEQGIRQNYTMGKDGTEDAITFYMPFSNANVTINYRRGTAPVGPDDPGYSDRILEMLVLDPDNVGTGDPLVYDDNWAKAEITGATAASMGPLGLDRASVRDMRYVKAGDRVTLEYSPTAGYALEIITVTAGGETLLPTYTVRPTYAAPGRASFVMPDANATVVVRFRAVTADDPAHRYTANLILHPPGDDSVGVGTFDHDLSNRYYSRLALPGERVDFTAWAKDGYYIKRISVTPAILGVSAHISGALGRQNGFFVMPAADVQVNVFFEKLDEEKPWPGEVPYSLSLEVYDATGKGGKASFGAVGGNTLISPDNDPVGSWERKTLWDYAKGGSRVSIHERDRVFVALSPAPGTYTRSVAVTDSRGMSVPWSYVPGGIAFDMSPAHVTVTVHYAQRTGDIDNGRKHRVTLHISNASGADAARLEWDDTARAVITLNVDGEYNEDMFAGDILTLTATPDRAADPYHSVVSAYAVVAGGVGPSSVIPTTGLLPGSPTETSQTGMPLVAAGGQIQFAMPDADADVYVTFLGGGLPKPGELTGTLMVMGPVGSGSAVMTAAEGSKRSTGTVTASGGGALFAPQRTPLTVDLTVNNGYAISAIRVLDSQGKDVPYVWTDGTQRQFTLTMPDVDGVRVYVELERVDASRELTAQVVVNNGGGTGNTARLRTGGAVGSGVALLNPVHPGERLYLDLTVQPGYRIASLQVVPAKFGIAPSLDGSKKDTQDQTTSFTMPGEDVVVYVHFARDTRTRWTVNLKTTGQYHQNNQARIHSDFSGWSAYVSPSPSTYTNGKDTVFVQAGSATATDPADWVTVNYEWDENDAVDYVTVTYDDGVTAVPFTQNVNPALRKGEITFPMVDANVIVTVHYKDAPDPATYEAVLHVIDLDNNAAEITDFSWAKLTWSSETTGNLTARYPFPGNEATIRVPAGQTVVVDADTVSAGVYLWAGYVIYRQGGQMIRFEFDPDNPGPGFSGAKRDTFVMHPGRNDVYIYFTKTVPTETDYSAVLMLDSPAADVKSTAVISTDGDSAQTATVTANTPPDHAYIVATVGDTITVSVRPDAGYTVESILLTPLGVVNGAGIPIVPHRSGNSYIFTMPAQNVAVRVKLKTDVVGEHVATLHYNSADVGDGYVPEPDKVAWAILNHDTAVTNIDGGRLMADRGKTLNLSVCLNEDYLVLAAYVLRPDGTMVPLSDSLERATDVNKGKYDIDKSASFQMPESDVDVYVWFTKTPPADRWRTAVLTVTDDDGAGVVNSGLNTARFWTDSHPQATEMQVVESRGTPAHGFFWVKEGEQVTVKIDLPASGYGFSDPAHITHSVTSAGTPTLTENPSNAPEYVYTYNVGNCNSAVYAHFVASAITQNPMDVVVIDRENPGGDQNKVEVSPASLPKLTLISSSSAGARQRVPGVISGATVDFVIRPQPGYTAVAHLITSGSGGGRRQLTLTGNTGNFSMPDHAATLEITLVKTAYSATLSILDTRDRIDGVTTNVSTAQMTEDAFLGKVNASTGPATPPATGTEKGTFPVLPNGTELVASVDRLGANTRVIGGLLLTNQGSQVLPAVRNGTTNVDEYIHRLNGRSAELRILVEPEPTDPADRTYIASVRAVRLPAGTAAPSIAADPLNPLSDNSWTAAKAGDGITVTLDVPHGYRADLTVDGTDVTLSKTSVDATSTYGITGDTVVFNVPGMPARNVTVTVTYVRTRFTATIVTGGAGSGSATLTEGSRSVTAPGTVNELLGGETLNFTAVPADGSLLTAIMLTTADGATRRLSHTDGVGSLTMPGEDVTVTVIFGKKRSHYLDLHVNGTDGGTATLTASRGGTVIGKLTSTPAAPNGFSRIEAVEVGSDGKLTVSVEAGYIATLGYYLHNGGALIYVTDTITPNPDTGGEATFTMPDTRTCIYVTFRKGENPPKVNPDGPDDPDPNHYLDLHVSGTGGGTAVLDAGAKGKLITTPTNPRSVGTLRPIGTGTPVTLTVTPEAGYTAMVGYYVYHNGIPVPVQLTTVPPTGTGGSPVTFTMPSQSTCVYVTFRGPDKLPYLDLHVSNTRGGTATLSTDGFGTLTSTPAAPNGFSRINAVETGTPVKLEVTPGADYTVSVSYYRHDGRNLYYESYLIDTDNGGTATFDMPAAATCIRVAFHGPGDEPIPDPNDPKKYLDLHVSGTQGGSATLTPAGLAAMSSTPTNPNSFSQRKPVDKDTPVTLDVRPEPGYTVSVSYYVHNNGSFAYTSFTVDSDNGGTASFLMPAQSTCIHVTFKRQKENPDPDDPQKYLDLHVNGTEGGSATLIPDGMSPMTSTPANPNSFSQRKPVAADTPVTLSVAPRSGYTVSVSYYVHNNGTIAVTSAVDSDNGGTASFLMPAQSTCVHVSFTRQEGPNPDDFNKYLDLHVNGTQGGSATLTPDGIAPLISTPTAPNSFSQRKPVDKDTPVTLDVTPEPGYTVSVSYYVHNSGTIAVTSTVDSDNGGTASFPMPAESTCVHVTFTRKENPKPDDPEKYLDLHVNGTEGGSATLTPDGMTPLISTPTLPSSFSQRKPVAAATPVTLDVTPEPGYTVSVSYYVHNNGSFAYTSFTVDSDNGGTASFLMPAQSTCIHVTFKRQENPPPPNPPPEPPPPEPPEPERYIAFVTLVGTDGEPLNSAQSIVDMTTAGLGGGTLWAYGVAEDVMKTSFTAAPGYYATVTAKRLDTNDPLFVGQQGTTNAATATSSMPSLPAADMEVTITYSKDPPPPSPHKLTLRLVGHGGLMGNLAALQGGASALTLSGAAAPTGANVEISTTADLGARLDLDANRESNYAMRATLEYTDSNGLPCVVNLPLNEYGTNGTCLLFMPDADAVVTVYYRMPYKATLFVIDAAGRDFDGGSIGETVGSGVVPKTTLAVTDAVGNPVPGSPVTRTHTPITNLTGTENTATTVDKTTLPAGIAVSAVVATTAWGTVNLTETTGGVYPFSMSAPSRAASDVELTVILQDTEKPPLYVATVYKVGHDNQPGNGADIFNITNPPPAVPKGTIWSGAYGADAMEVRVTTAPGYYAVVTAVRTGTTQSVPVLQWTTQGPFTASFVMPTSNVDVTVTYVKTPPEAFLVLELAGHDRKAGNRAYVNDGDTALLIPTLSFNGAGAADPVRKVSDGPVEAGTNLEILTGIADGYHVDSITLTVPGLAPIPLTLSAAGSALTQMPVITGGGQAVLTVKIAPGQKSPRPFDPEHSTIYNSGNYPIPATPANPGNPDLSADPAGEQGWILAENKSAETEGTFTVTIPTLYDKPEPDKRDTLHDAGKGNELTADPVYTFYWKNDVTGEFVKLAEGTDIATDATTPAATTALAPGDNPKGSYPSGDTHYGYKITMKSLIQGSKLSTYLEEGGILYVTATLQENTASGAGWTESDKTQVILEPAKTYTATLHIVDVSSALGNKVELSVDGDTGHVKFGTAVKDKDKLEDLIGKEKLRTKVTPDAKVRVVSVLGIPKKGSPGYLSPDLLLGGDYPYGMTRDDVDIVVTLANEDEELYTATVVKVDPDEEPGNTVAISNLTHPVLNRDPNAPGRWTMAYPGDEIRVDATAAPGYRAVVAVRRLDNGLPVPTVAPTSGAGTMVITLPGKMPASNIEITVTFEKVTADDQRWVTLRMRMDSVNGPLPIDPANRAEALVAAASFLKAESVNGYTDKQLLLTAPGALDVSAVLASGYAVQGWYVDGVVQAALGTGLTGTVAIPAPAGISDTVITVVLKETPVTDRTPRPFDPAHSVEYTDADGYTGPGSHQNGYLLAVNKGNSQVQITVPNLYDGPLHAAENVKYKLYAKVGGVMVPLREGVDYDTVIPVAEVGGAHHAGATDWTGQVFTIQSLDPTGALGDYVRNGGVIYITATAPGKDESGYTEVILPADSNRNYTATLKIIDDTYNSRTNRAQMQNANSGDLVTWVTTGNPTDTAGSIGNLLGGELIRTEVDPDPSVTYTVMAHTASRGDVLLAPDPSGTDRYLRDMPAEDMDIIVHFRDKNEHIHIAAVEKRGATAVPGNEADIGNTTSVLPSGDIWTEGRCDVIGGTADKIGVEVFTAEGFYATVTMSYRDPVTGDPVEKTLVTMGSSGVDATGPTPVPIPLRVSFDMPDADVQVVVLFEAGKKSPRPFDPNHSQAHQDPADTDPYTHNGPEDQSTTHQEGWLLGENLGGGSALVTIPTLWSEKDDLENADNADFHFYLREKDSAGAYTGSYIRLEEGVDYTLAHYDPKGTDPVFTAVTNTYVYPDPAGGTNPVTNTYTGVKFRLLEVAAKDASGDPVSKLYRLLDSGLSLFVSATKREAVLPPWVEGEMTELVIPSTGLRPHDPDRVNPVGTVNPTYEDHWIRAENRGDYLLVTVPQLNSPNGDAPTEVDGTKHRLQLHLQIDGTGRTGAIINVSDLLNIQNVRDYEHFWNVNLEYRPGWRTDPTLTPAYTPYLFDPVYESEVYYTDTAVTPDKPYHGARFAVEIKSDTAIDADAAITDKAAAKANAAILRQIFDNRGTMNAADAQEYRMYITSDEVENLTDPLPEFRFMDYTDFEVPRYYSLAGDLESWAPTHIAELRLYRADAAASGGYESKPWLMLRSGLSKTVSRAEYDPAVYNGHWSMEFAFKSSELASADTVLDYRMVVKKPAHLTYTHTKIELDTAETVLYDSNTLVFRFARPVSLFCGDIAPLLGPNQRINDQDRDMLAGFNYGLYQWSEEASDTGADWGCSTFNPDSYAYMADLNGDGIISERDMAVLMSDYNWRRRTLDYGAPEGLDDPGNGIMLLMEELLVEAVEEEVPSGPPEASPEGAQPPEERGETPEAPVETPEPPEETPGTPAGPPEVPEVSADPEEPGGPAGSAGPALPEGITEPDVTDSSEIPDAPDNIQDSPAGPPEEPPGGSFADSKACELICGKEVCQKPRETGKAF